MSQPYTLMVGGAVVWVDAALGGLGAINGTRS
jgi:hypothetical protein